MHYASFFKENTYIEYIIQLGKGVQKINIEKCRWKGSFFSSLNIITVFCLNRRKFNLKWIPVYEMEDAKYIAC